MEDFPRTIVWCNRKTATERLGNISIPSYTDKRRIVFCPELSVWREIYLAQLEDLSGEIADRLRSCYENRLTEDHVLQILGHEFAHHGEYFSDEDYEAGPWYEEGMAEYISRRELLTEAGFAEKAGIERLLIELLTPRFGEMIPAPATGENYAAVFFGYWRAFAAAQKRVDACGGNLIAALRRGLK